MSPTRFEHTLMVLPVSRLRNTQHAIRSPNPDSWMVVPEVLYTPFAYRSAHLRRPTTRASPEMNNGTKHAQSEKSGDWVSVSHNRG